MIQPLMKALSYYNLPNILNISVGISIVYVGHYKSDIDKWKYIIIIVFVQTKSCFLRDWTGDDNRRSDDNEIDNAMYTM